MSLKIKWPEFRFPPINLYVMPRGSSSMHRSFEEVLDDYSVLDYEEDFVEVDDIQTLLDEYGVDWEDIDE